MLHRVLVVAVAVAAGCASRPAATPTPPPVPAPASRHQAVTGASARPHAPKVIEHPDKEARHLKVVQALTTDGKNGEAYFSPDGKQIAFQSVRGDSPYYQIYVMNEDGTGQRLLSTGRGKTTCAYFRPDGGKLIYASTHSDPKAFKPGRDPRPPEAPRGERYKWDFDPHMEIYEVAPDGGALRRLTVADGYDAEGSYGPNGLDIVFTSMRDGDAEIYLMDGVGTNPRRLTRSPGYDGGPFLSPDGRLIAFRSFRYGRDDRAEVFVMGKDGSGERAITDLGVVSWAPFFHPDGKRIIFAANVEGHNFELYLVNVDGSGLERVTWEPRFDGLPSFSGDGRRVVWTSNRGPGGDPARGVSQVYIADWID